MICPSTLAGQLGGRLKGKGLLLPREVANPQGRKAGVALQECLRGNQRGEANPTKLGTKEFSFLSPRPSPGGSCDEVALGLWLGQAAAELTQGSAMGRVSSRLWALAWRKWQSQ